ncbi:MAG: hypothetical protein ACFFCW_10165 [Candidatus Hodarchaeota archaeon]
MPQIPSQRVVAYQISKVRDHSESPPGAQRTRGRNASNNLKLSCASANQVNPWLKKPNKSNRMGRRLKHVTTRMRSYKGLKICEKQEEVLGRARKIDAA